jgi:hypothetical protein
MGCRWRFVRVELYKNKSTQPKVKVKNLKTRIKSGFFIYKSMIYLRLLRKT